MSNWLLFVFAAVFLVLIPLAPKLLRLRIRFLRWIHWEWAARLNEDHFQGWCWFLRVVFLLIAATLFYVGWAR
ncbi:MAG: hypothetical protein J4F38_09340 [Pseudomonadales bacterium]|nr:hypothetical protein [Pseudomonadales bacterium]